jgi:hypothetical protein
MYTPLARPETLTITGVAEAVEVISVPLALLVVTFALMPMVHMELDPDVGGRKVTCGLGPVPPEFTVTVVPVALVPGV